MTKKNEEKINLEQSFAQLEKITEELQSENLDLEIALDKFERGLALAEKLKTRLNQIETKIETIRLKFRKTPEEESEPGEEK